MADALSQNAILGAINTYKSDLEDQIKEKGKTDENDQKLKEKVAGNTTENDESFYKITENGLLVYKNSLYIPNVS